jgi:hypothetical protein
MTKYLRISKTENNNASLDKEGRMTTFKEVATTAG